MAKVFGEELRKQVEQRKQSASERINRRQEHIDNCDFDWDDCFVSDHLDSDTIYECNMQLEILSGDGLMDFDAIFDQDGKEVRVTSFINQWGKYTVVGNGIFASSKSALLKKTGWTEHTIKVPVWTHYVPSGRGMAGVCGGSSQKCRWHTNMVTGEYVGFPG